MGERLFQKENLVIKLHWLMLARVIIVTLLLGIIAFIDIKETEALPKISFLYLIILLTYSLSVLYLFLLKSIRNLRVNI